MKVQDLLLRPDNKGTTRASVNYWHEGPAEAHFAREESIRIIRQVLQGASWEADRIAQDLPLDKDLYLGPVSQVRIPQWSKGRCALVGDSAYCPTPFTGMGTTLAIIGAYVLAGELATQSSYQQAFANYESKLRPFVEEIQKVIPGQFRLVYPQSKLGVKIFNGAAKFFASKPIQGVAQFLEKKPKEDQRQFKLPTYELR